MITKLKLAMTLALLLASSAAAWQGGKGEVNFFENYVDVEGIAGPGAGVPPNSPLAYAQAQRAALAVANRNLAEIIAGIQVDSRTVVENLALSLDKLETIVRANIKGGQAVKQTSRSEFDGIVSVTVRVPLTGSGSVMSGIMPTLRDEIIKREADSKMPVFTPVVVAPPAPPPRSNAAPPSPPPSPAPTAPDFDGLIIRVPPSFKPAIAPKILTEKGEILYSSKDVAVDILISRGAAQYTNNEGKAKTILEGMGAKVILSVDGSLRTDTDAEVKTDDAARVFNANKKTLFLNKGRVVFLVSRS